MDRVSLLNVGSDLVADLENASKGYHVKSEKYEILSWEAVGIGNMLKQLQNNVDLTYGLSESALLSEWGKQLYTEQCELAERVKKFRKYYSEFQST